MTVNPSEVFEFAVRLRDEHVLTPEALTELTGLPLFPAPSMLHGIVLELELRQARQTSTSPDPQRLLPTYQIYEYNAAPSPHPFIATLELRAPTDAANLGGIIVIKTQATEHITLQTLIGYFGTFDIFYPPPPTQLQGHQIGYGYRHSSGEINFSFAVTRLSPIEQNGLVQIVVNSTDTDAAIAYRHHRFGTRGSETPL